MAMKFSGSLDSWSCLVLTAIRRPACLPYCWCNPITLWETMEKVEPDYVDPQRWRCRRSACTRSCRSGREGWLELEGELTGVAGRMQYELLLM